MAGWTVSAENGDELCYEGIELLTDWNDRRIPICKENMTSLYMQDVAYI